MAGMDWGEILRRAGIPEPPGRAEMIAAIKAKRAQQLADQQLRKGAKP